MFVARVFSEGNRNSPERCKRSTDSRKSVFGKSSALNAQEADGFETTGAGLAGIESQRDFTEQGLPRPAGGQVYADAARGFTDARADFE
jgi:hypothetical protein